MDQIRTIIQLNNRIKRSTIRTVKQFLHVQERFVNAQKAIYERLETIKHIAPLSLDDDKNKILAEFNPLEEVQLAVCGYNSSGKTSFMHEILGCGDFLPVDTGAVTVRIVKFSYAPPDKACLIKYVSVIDHKLIGDPIDLSEHFQSNANTRTGIRALRKIVKEQLGRPVDMDQKSNDFREWAKIFIEIRIPSENLKPGLHIYDTPGFLESDASILRKNLLDLVATVCPTLLFLYDNPTGSDDSRQCYKQLKGALRSEMMGVDIFFLNTKADVAVIQKDARQRDDEDEDNIIALLHKERSRRYNLLMNIEEMKSDVEHRNAIEPSFDQCESFDIFSCLSPTDPLEIEMKRHAIDRIIRFVADHDLRSTKFVAKIILSAIDMFFDFVLLTNRRSTDDWNNLRDDALRWGERFFEHYRSVIDNIAQEANQRLPQRFDEKKSDIEKRAIKDSETRGVQWGEDSHPELDSNASGAFFYLSLFFLKVPIHFFQNRNKKHEKYEMNFIDTIVESEVMQPIFQNIFHEQSNSIKQNMTADSISYRNKNELLCAAHREVLLQIGHFNTIDDWSIAGSLLTPVVCVLMGTVGLFIMTPLTLPISLWQLYKKDMNYNYKEDVLDDRKKMIKYYLVDLESQMGKMGDHMKKGIIEWIGQEYEKFKKKVDFYHRIILRTMEDRQKAYDLAREFIPEFTRIECQLVASLDLAIHNGSHPIVDENEVLGEGGFFTVHLASWDDERQLVAKKLQKHFNDQKFAYIEAHFHRSVTNLNIPHIIPLKYLYINDNSLNILLPRYSTNLKLFLEENMNRVTAEKAIEISRNITSVIAHMHSYDLVHRDIKPENILMDEREQVYLADFGTCQHGTENATIIGSSPLPPDIAALTLSTSSSSSTDRLQSYQGSAVDVYLLGTLMFVCAPKENYIPTSNINSEQVQRLDRQKVPESYCQLILRCLEKDSKKRPTAKEILDEIDSIEKSLCMICKEAPRFVRCLPCGHKTTCVQCHAQLRQRSNELICINCRQIVTDVQEDNNTNTFFFTPTRRRK